MELFPRICACFQSENGENSKANWRISEKNETPQLAMHSYNKNWKKKPEKHT